MDARGQRRYQGSAMGIALALSLLAHLPLLLLWNAADPAPPVLAGERVHLQLSAPPERPLETGAAETVPEPTRSRLPQPGPRQPTSGQPKDTTAKPTRPMESPVATAPTGSSTTAPVSPRISPPPLPPAKPAVADPTPAAAQLAAQSATPPLSESAKPQNTAPDRELAHGPSLEPAISKPRLAAQTAKPAPSPAARQQLQQALNRALVDHFSYPLKARRRHWEGEVVLRVTILHDGQIGAARVDKSSGYRLLDQAALKSLRQITSLAGFTLERDVDLLLPVIYRLQG